MNSRTFAAFVAPSLVMMLVFIAAPLVYVFGQSFYLTTPVTEQVTVETCTPGFLNQTCTQETKSLPKLDAGGQIVTETRFVGLQSYASILEPAKAWAATSALDYRALMAIDFWRALRFTLMFTFVTLPLVLILGLAVALAVNNAARSLRGPVIFVSLLPFIITPVIGALSIRWLFVSDGLLNHGLEWLLGHPVSMFSQGWTIEILMMTYRVWHVAPFAFIILYAGLQTLNQDAIEAAMIDGASRWQRLRYVIVPHLAPLIVFVALIHLMDAYRVFDEVVGFRAEAHVISLQYLTYDFLVPDNTGNRSISRAAASSMLTMIGIVILLIPLLRRTWKQHRGAR
jgi:multiple sugar transport system permease protein